MTLSVKPLGKALGAEVSGIDWRGPVDPDTIAAVTDALHAFHLVCLRTEPLPPRVFAGVGRAFGEAQIQLLRKHRIDDAPGVSVFDSSYHAPDDKPEDLSRSRRSGWHTDDSYFEIPAKITLLQALEIPDRGGETRFCNARAAYDDLSEEMKAKLGNLQAVHSYDTLRAPARADTRTKEEEDDTPDVIHPLIRTHDASGQKAIYFNSNRTDRIVDMERAASDALLDRIHAHMTQLKYQYHHRWLVGDVLLWDNRSVTHSVNMDFPVGQKRIHQRILLKGLKPV